MRVDNNNKKKEKVELFYPTAIIIARIYRENNINHRYYGMNSARFIQFINYYELVDLVLLIY
jgi:hypothetical protein